MGSENALEQIKAKDYVRKYMSDTRDIYLVGINFDRDTKSIDAFEWERA